jgi:hypothetical protein
MPVRNYPFSVIRPGDIARPYLPVTIINPNTEKQVGVYTLIDTGADECDKLSKHINTTGSMTQRLNRR